MSEQIIKFDRNNIIDVEYSSEIKDEYDHDNKVCVSQTTVNACNSKLNEIRKFETLSLNHIKTHLPSSGVSDTINNSVKKEDGICFVNKQIEFCNELVLCNHCHEVYQDYCTKCRVLLHILNKRHFRDTNNRVRELPNYMLETREIIGQLGIFSLKVIPEDVRFGPFTGLTSAGRPLRIRGGRFVVSDDNSEHLNWMQYINPARNIYEQNLFPFQYEDELYYYSTRRIQEGEELLVYFGDNYKDNLLKNVEMDFVPIIKQDVENVFACTFCCLGFSLKEYLVEHKAACHNETKEMFSAEELAQCPVCKIYLEAKEYFEHHIDYCCETNDRYCVLPTQEMHKLEAEWHLSIRNEAERWNHEIYKCTKCKFTTMYKADFRHHTNDHYEGKMYKCEICHRKFKAEESLKTHIEKIHVDNDGSDAQRYSACDYFKANIKNMKDGSRHDGEKQYQASKSKLQTRNKCHLKSVVKIDHLNRGKYKCANCEFETHYRTYLERHMKIKHPMECHYKCAECEFKTNYVISLRRHIKTKHPKENNYNCTECEYKTNTKLNLKIHIKARHPELKVYKCTECEFKTKYKEYLERHVQVKHLKIGKYKCAACEYKTCYKTNLKVHFNAKHLEVSDYKCTECEFKTKYKQHLRRHAKTRHLEVSNYNCTECEYHTNAKSCLEVHVKSKHLKQNDYKCPECEYETNYKSHLQVHIKAKHLKGETYKCMECEYESYYKSSLVKHVKTKHVK